MPFRKIGPDKYVSDSGNEFTEAQVRLYHANNGFPKKKKTTKMRTKKKPRR